MLNRRQFHSFLFASLALALARPNSLFASPANTQASLWLNRLTFGANAASLEEFSRMGPAAWLDRQLSFPAHEPQIMARLASAMLRIVYEAGVDENGGQWTATDEMRPLDTLYADPAAQLHRIDWEQPMEYSERSRPAAEVIAAALTRAVHAPAQLREVMTQFWHDHFNVNSQKDEFTAAFFPTYDAMIREHAFGNFRVLLGEMARSPAMLYYLNNADSRASPANENFGRELLELHTLGAENYLNDRYSDWHSVPKDQNGVAQGYLDLDVYEVARAFTGWSVGDGRYVDEGNNAPKTGTFHYIEAWHDPYQKRVLGIEFEPNRAPMADGEQVLDILAAHPGTARFVCRKIARRLLTDQPDDALVETLASVFLQAKDAPDQISQVIRALVNHPSFDATPAGKLRRPFEFLAAIYRASGAEMIGRENNENYQLMRAGWRQHSYGAPTGHPDVLEKWTGASSLNRLIDYAVFAHEEWFSVAKVDFSANPGETTQDFADRYAQRLGGPIDGLLAAMGVDPAAPAQGLSPDEQKAVASSAIAFAALSPAFLLR